jgi:hypothetical protein
MKQLLAQQSSNAAGNSVINPITREISQAKVATNLNKGDDKLARSIVDKTGDGLNSNVIKLSQYITKLNKSIETSIKVSTKLSTQQVGDITTNAMGKKQFNTLKPRVEGFKANVKDFFSMRGFLDKTGIAKRGSGGLVSEYLDRGEAKKKYVDQRMKTKGTTFGSKETFAKQFDEQKRIESEINKNEKQIKELQASGATDVGLKRGGFLKTRENLAAQYAKVAPDARPQNTESGSTSTEENVLPFKSKSKTSATAAGGEEAMLEQNKMVAEQTSLLIQIEENTRGGGDGKAKAGPPVPPQAGGGMGLMDMLGMGGVGGKVLGGVKAAATGVKAAGSFLGKGALTAAKFIGRNPLLMAGTAVAAGVYTGYKGYQAAGDKQDTENAQTDADLASGKITKEQAATQKEQTGDTATIGKSKSVGKGSGMAIGGAAGALKGAALGAALGSVVPVVGTAIGGLLGGAIGGIGGSYLGGKAGDYLGEKTGQVMNYVPKAYKSVKEGASNLYDGAKDKAGKLYDGVSSTASKFYDGASRMAGDAGEGLLRAKNKISDTAFNVTANVSDFVDRNTGGSLTKVGNAFSSAKNSVLGMFGMGDKVVDNGDGSKSTFKSDGTKIVQDGGGTKTFDKDGKLISERTPGFNGFSEEKRADGSKVSNLDQGPMSLKIETRADGGTQSTGAYDLGVTKVSKRETLTARQVKERAIDSKMADGLPDKIPVESVPVTSKPISAGGGLLGGAIGGANLTKEQISARNTAAFDKELAQAEGGTAPVQAAPVARGQTSSMIAGEPWTVGQELSKKQLAVMSSAIAGGTNYSARVMRQYDKQKGIAAAPVMGGAQSGVDGDILSKKSTENEQAKMDSMKSSSGGNTAVVAPTINNTSNQTQLIKSPIRNQESSQSKYLDSRYAF